MTIHGIVVGEGVVLLLLLITAILESKEHVKVFQLHPSYIAFVVLVLVPWWPIWVISLYVMLDSTFYRLMRIENSSYVSPLRSLFQ